ncbi:MAG: hypothetical protein WCX31_04515 [Salinivirgaceae bacterium]
MKEGEVSVTFHVDKDLLKNFEDAIRHKEKEIGVPLNRKQALHLAIKEASAKWKQKNPTL